MTRRLLGLFVVVLNVVVSPMGFVKDGVAHSVNARLSYVIGSTSRQLVWTDVRDGVVAVSFASAPLLSQ